MSMEVTQAIIGEHLKRLKLPTIAREYVPMAREAEESNAGYIEYLRALLDQEVKVRGEHQLNRRLKNAQFPYEKRLEDFDFSAVRSLQKAKVMELARGEFIRQHDNLILLGPSGLGKTQPTKYPYRAHVFTHRHR